MKQRLLAFGVPAVVVGAVFGGAVIGAQSGWIPPAVWQFLWPSLVALLFLLLALGAVFIRAWRWLWPFGAGFLVQTVTTLFIIPRWLKPIETLEYTGITVGLVLLVMLVIWLVVLLRARWLESRMVNGLSSATGVDQQEVAKIRKSMAEALALLKRAGGGRNAIYQLPWFLVIGRSQAGKTVAIKNSGLGLPVRKDWVKGVGGTHTCDFFFTNDLIFLDTPGDWVTKAADDSQQKEWVELVRLLRRYRGRRPLDGIVVLVPSDDLLTRSDQELSEQASNARVVIDLLQAELQFRFPVYLLVSKTDLVEGFGDFFRGVPARRRNEILGFSHEDPNAGDPPRLIRDGFRRVVGRLQAYRLEMLARIASKTQARRLFFFTDEFANLERPLAQFASVLFEESVQGDRPVFRGFYFTSGTQGEGTPLGQAMGNLARTLGVRLGGGAPQASAGEEEPKRGYFLLDLFRRLMIGDQGLVGRTAVHWWRRRRGTMVGTFLVPALLAVFFLLSLVSFAINSARYNTIGQEVPLLADELRKGAEFSGDQILEALGKTERIVAYHRKLTGLTLFAGFFMRRPGDLDNLVFQAFAEPFRDVILEPTLRETERFATDEEKSCTDRVDALYSVVWLREGHGAEWSSDLIALGKVWNLRDDEDLRDASLAREKILEQYAYFKDHAPRGTPLLPGFDLAKVATGLEKRCGRSGSLSSLEKYSKFLQSCGSAGVGQVVPCWKYDLDEVLRFAGEDAKRIRRHLKGLKQDLRDLRGEEVQAEAALDVVERLNVQEASSDSCDARFDRDVVPAIRKYADKQQPLIDECHEEWIRANRRRLSALKKVDDQEKALQEDAKRLNESLLDFEKRCADSMPSGIDFSVRPVSLLARDYRKLACQEQAVLSTSGPRRPGRGAVNAGNAAPALPPPVVGGGIEPPAEPKPSARTAVASRMLDYFEASVPLSRDWTYQGWSARKAAWQQESLEANSIGGDQGAELVAIVRRDVSAYGDDYYRAWKRYLAGLRPKEIRTSAPSWLQGLATTGEYRRLLAPGGPPVPPEAPDDPLVEAFTAGTAGLRPLAGFVAGELGMYQDLLGRIGADLERCAKDGTYWAQYRSQIANRAPENNVVRARDMVTRVAGTGLADGALMPFLMAPLDRAADYLASTDLVGRQWSDLTNLYKGVSGFCPFATDGAADALVERSPLIALLGGKSGVVPVLQEIGRSATLSPDAVDWLANASRLSGIFFEKGADEPRKLRLKVTLKEHPVTPEDAAKDYELRGIEIHLGSETKLKWDLTKAFVPEAGASCPLFGDEAPGRALISLVVSERKGAMGRAFTGNWKDAELKNVEAAGPWAVLRLLLMGAPEKLPESGNAVELAYPVRLVEKGKEMPTLTLRLKVEAEGLPAMLRLLRSGLRPPPEAPSGN